MPFDEMKPSDKLSFVLTLEKWLFQLMDSTIGLTLTEPKYCIKVVTLQAEIQCVLDAINAQKSQD
jgi:hypothetical protein